MLRDPAAADRWTWLIIACYAQLYLARPLAAAIRLPWQRPQPPGTMTPGRVRAGFRHARQALGSPASIAKPGKPGPGRPAGSKNKNKAPRQSANGTPRPNSTTTNEKKNERQVKRQGIDGFSKSSSVARSVRRLSIEATFDTECP